MQNLHVNTIIAKFFVGQNIVTSQKQAHDLPFFGGWCYWGVWYGTSIARNKIPNFQNPKAFILEGLEKN